MTAYDYTAGSSPLSDTNDHVAYVLSKSFKSSWKKLRFMEVVLHHECFGFVVR